MMVRPYLNLAKNVLVSNVKRVPFPYKLTYSLTNRCNYRCRTCNIWQRKPVNELSFMEINKFFERSNQFSWIHLTGGEIFLRPDLLDIVKVILDQCSQLLLLNFPTNGFLTKTIVSTIKKILTLKPPELFITVSLDGEEKLNDDIRGVPGGWKRQIKTFQELHGLPDVKSALGLTLSPYNVDRFETAFQAAQKECPWLTYDDFHINVYHTSFYYGNTEHPLTPREEENILQQINRYRRLRRLKFHPISYLEWSYLKKVETYLLTGLTPIPCHALRSSCFMDPSGNIFPCSMYERTIGNIRNHDYRLLSIWKSESAIQVQQEIENFHCPQCWTPCEAYQSILGNLAPRIFKVRKRLPPNPIGQGPDRSCSKIIGNK